MGNENLKSVLEKFHAKITSENKVLSNDGLQKETEARPVYKDKILSSQIMTYDEGKHHDVLCGNLVGTTFYRRVKPEHFMRIVQGWGIQEDAFQHIVQRGCKHIVMQADEGNFISDIEEWLKPTIRVMQFGHGYQRFLPKKYMTDYR